MSAAPPAGQRHRELLAAAIERGPLVLYGLGITNRSVAAQLVTRDVAIRLGDDRGGDAAAAALGLSCAHPDAAGVDELLAGAGALLPTPGLVESHPVFAAARRLGVPILSEFDLAAAWDDRPIVCVTGTNGKTTVTSLIVECLERSGIPAALAGNTDVPLVDAIADPVPHVFVVEASSFRLGHSAYFTPRVGTWLNFAPDHLDVHASLETYEAAKAVLWRDQVGTDCAVINLDDPIVAAHGATATARHVTYSTLGPADYCREGARLVRTDGSTVAELNELSRALPHDLSNALAAAASAEAVGATPDGVAAALRTFRLADHRVQSIAEHAGVRWVDDSKSTSPHSIVAAVAGFDSVVLIAGGRNKGLDLGVLGQLGPQVRAVVGLGEAGAAVDAAAGPRAVGHVATMDEAVSLAATLARAGDVVLLSPGCASFDAYGSYAERGRDFVRAVSEIVLGESGGDHAETDVKRVRS